MNRKLYFLISNCVLLIICFGCVGPEPTRQEFGVIDVSEDPVQITVGYDTVMIISDKHGEFTLSLVAEYKMSVVLVCKQTFSLGWQAKLAPIDLSFCWGEIAESENDKYVSFTHKGRWYYFDIMEDSPFDKEYVYNHSSNNHIIPATKNILLAVKSIKKKTPVILKGYLVDMTGKYKDDSCWWSTSRVRSDDGQGSCELFYVNRVRIGNDVYE